MSTPPSLPDDFQLVLRPNMSLSRRGFTILMVAFGAVSLIAGGYFWALGAWPVFGFFGLDVALLYGFFKLNYRAGQRYEVLEMRDGKLVLAQVSPLGEARDFVFDPYWVQLRLERFGADDDQEIGRLLVSSHGRTISVGAFLSPDERAGLFEALQAKLAAMRAQPATN